MGNMSSLQLAAAFAVTSFAGALMFFQGLGANLLERRRETRCRACGGITGRTCTCGRDD
jgi:hypothetical protein